VVNTNSQAKVFAVVIAIVVAAAVLAWLFREPMRRGYEDAMFALDHTAVRAVRYGERHFTALSPAEYDVDRAEYFFAEALRLDPSSRYALHELARIAFLKSDFGLAESRIDTEIAVYGKENPNAYYVRALIYGYQGRYLDAAKDYETYFKMTPATWGAINDYSWVLLKAELPEGALAALEWGLKEWPGNPWLLHNQAIALYELQRYEESAAAAALALAGAETLTREDWLVAYPGNDPRVAAEGLATFRAAAAENLAKAEAAQ
jgi:tetratricopeptide (TPR) repeat protein